MRGWTQLDLPPSKRLCVLDDKVEVIGELVDLTLIQDSEEEDAHLPKKAREKKAKQREKKRKEEQKKAEMKQAALAKKKAAAEARLKRDAEEEAKRKADEAARRYAERMEARDKSTLPPATITAPTEKVTPQSTRAILKSMIVVTAKPAKPPAALPETVEVGTAGLAENRKAGAHDAPGRRRTPQPAEPTPPVSAKLRAPSPARRLPHGMPTSQDPEVTVKMKPAVETQKADANDADFNSGAQSQAAKGKTMAEVIAAAQKEQSSNSSGFASFEAFDAQSSHFKAHGMDEPENDPDDEDDIDPDALLPMEFYSLQDLPEELLAAGDMGSEPGLYVAHFVRFVLGCWQRTLSSGKPLEGPGLTAQSAALFQSKAKLRETTEALKPLLRQLWLRKVTDEVLRELEKVVRHAADRDYIRANEVYVAMTMGRKTWHNSLPCFQQQQNHGGSVRKIIKQSELVDFDWDPVMQAYMHALKRLIQFVQCVRPPDSPSGFA